MFKKRKKIYEQKILEKWYGPLKSPLRLKIDRFCRRVKFEIFMICFGILMITAILWYIIQIPFYKLFGLDGPPEPW